MSLVRKPTMNTAAGSSLLLELVPAISYSFCASSAAFFIVVPAISYSFCASSAAFFIVCSIFWFFLLLAP